MREWFRVQLSEVLGENPENIHHVDFNLHEAKDDIILGLYDYQLVRGWPSIAKHTADIVGYDESAIRKTRRRKR